MPRSAQFDRQALTALAAKQHGVVTRVQALESGMTRRVVDYRIRRLGCGTPIATNQDNTGRSAQGLGCRPSWVIVVIGANGHIRVWSLA